MHSEDFLHPLFAHYMTVLDSLHHEAESLVSKSLFELEGLDSMDDFPSLVNANSSQYLKLNRIVKQTKQLFTALKDQLPSVAHTAWIIGKLWDSFLPQDKHDWMRTLAIHAKDAHCVDLMERLGCNVDDRVGKCIFTKRSTSAHRVSHP